MASVAVIKMAEESPNSHRSVSPTEETPSVPPSSSSGRRSGTKKKKTAVTVPKPFNLSIEKRIQERQAFQEVQDQRQKEAEERERLNQEEREREEKKSLKEYRKSLEFKAKPIGKYRGITMNPSTKELTVPQGPSLSSVSRTRVSGARLPSDGASPEDLNMMSPSSQENREEHFEKIL